VANNTREEARRPFATGLAITAAAGWLIVLTLGWSYTALEGAHQQQVTDLLTIENELRHELEEQRQTAERYAALYERTSALQAQQLGRDHDEAGAAWQRNATAAQSYDVATLERGLEEARQLESATRERAREAGRAVRDHLASAGIQLERLAQERQQVEMATSALATGRDKLAAEIRDLQQYREQLSAQVVSLMDGLAEKNIDYTTITGALQVARAELMALESKLSATQHGLSAMPKARRPTIPPRNPDGTTGKPRMPAPATTSGTERGGRAASRKPAQSSSVGEEMMMFKRDQ
jgi:DNA repair exonuclease SbcCD ATPase subunit